MAFDWDPARDLGPYIETHLGYELKYLLVAATTWSAVHAEGDRWRGPNHLVVMAMESAFTHTRNLSEFLLLEDGWRKRSPHQPPDLPLWGKYQRPLHMKVLHPDPSRPYLPGERGGDDLNDRVVDLATEMLNGWAVVSEQPAMAALREVMDAARAVAVAEAEDAAGRMGIESPFASG